MVMILHDSELRSTMAASAKKWSNTHSWDNAANEFENVIESSIDYR